MKRPTLTLTSLVKKVFRPGERSLPRDQIIERLEELLHSVGLAGNVEEYLGKVLNTPDAPFRVGRSEAIIELAYQPRMAHDIVYRYLQESRMPKTNEQLIRELRNKTSFSWNQAARQLTLESDPRFIQYLGDDRWFLAEWKLANDDVYEYMVRNAVHQIPFRSLTYAMEDEMGLPAGGYVFLPGLDDRFRVEGEFICLQREVPDRAEEEVAATREAATKDEKTTNREEFAMTITHETTRVNDLLQQAVELLEKRNEEMAQEVVQHFQASNLQAIEDLMAEKQRNEQAVQGIKQVLAGLAQQ